MKNRVLYTIGYGGDQPSAFLDRLTEAGIDLVIDVRREGSRARLLSYNPSDDLEEGMPVLLATRGIEYRNASEFANPYKPTHKSPKTLCLKKYSTHLISLLRKQEGRGLLHCMIWEIKLHKRTAFLCAERNVLTKDGEWNCHRGIIAKRIAWILGDRDGSDWLVIHL